MIQDKDGDINNDALYNQNINFLPGEIKSSIENSLELMHFMFDVYHKAMGQLAPELQKLMWQQYPVFKTEKRPFVLESINDITFTTGGPLLWKLFYLVQGQKAGENIRNKYPGFEHYVECYGRPQQPETIDESTRPEYPLLTDEEWEMYCNFKNKALLESFNKEEKRKFEFIELMQTVLFKYFKELEELNSDEWIIYAVDIIEEYETYRRKCSDIELFIDGGFPEEDIKRTEEEFRQNYHSLSQEITDKKEQLRNRR
ncbi:MAG: hypothetical protein NTY07_21285 [Bacteroidia bacterium]|nr:hypothetical protein [Bacteroidia bacterium]